MEKYNSQSYSSNTSQHTKAVAPAALAARTAAAAARTASPIARTAAPAAVLTALKKLIKKYTGNCKIDIKTLLQK